MYIQARNVQKKKFRKMVVKIQQESVTNLTSNWSKLMVIGAPSVAGRRDHSLQAESS